MLSISLWSGSSFKTLGYPGLVFQNFFSPYTPRLKPRPPHKGAASEKGEQSWALTTFRVSPSFSGLACARIIWFVFRETKNTTGSQKNTCSSHIHLLLYIFFYVFRSMFRSLRSTPGPAPGSRLPCLVLRHAYALRGTRAYGCVHFMLRSVHLAASTPPPAADARPSLAAGWSLVRSGHTIA
jgi:hypothetical protein